MQQVCTRMRVKSKDSSNTYKNCFFLKKLRILPIEKRFVEIGEDGNLDENVYQKIFPKTLSRFLEV